MAMISMQDISKINTCKENMNIHIRAYVEMKFKMKQNFVKSPIK